VAKPFVGQLFPVRETAAITQVLQAEFPRWRTAKLYNI